MSTDKMRMTRFYIKGIPVTKKNSQRLAYIGTKCPKCGKGKFIKIRPSAQFEKYEQEALRQLRSQLENGVCKDLNPPLEISCVYSLPLNKDGSVPKRLPDLTNLLEATDDILVDAGIIPDDNVSIIASHDGSRVQFVKGEENSEVYIFMVEKKINYALEKL